MIVIESYNPVWPHEFETIRSALQDDLVWDAALDWAKCHGSSLE